LKYRSKGTKCSGKITKFSPAGEKVGLVLLLGREEMTEVEGVGVSRS